jgi:hypothetical protein
MSRIRQPFNNLFTTFWKKVGPKNTTFWEKVQAKQTGPKNNLFTTFWEKVRPKNNLFISEAIGKRFKRSRLDQK